MSDSDDTDILLLIPPDFFLVDSSDADSVSHGDNLAGRTVVNDLISHVNELEDRIAQIEKKDTSFSKLNDSTSSVYSSPSSNLMRREMNPSSRHLGSDSSLNSSPSRRVTRHNSLPPTPSSSYRSLAPSSRTWGRNYSSPSKVVPKTYRNFSDDGWENLGREKPKGNELLSEVDTFLDGLKRDSAASRANKDNDLVAGALPPSPQKRDSANGVARLQLDEVDRLLKEVEAEQKNIEARLGTHDAPEVRRIVHKPGETIGSIPDLGFGVREHWKDVDRFLEKERSQKPVDRFLEKERYQPPIEEPIATTRKQYQLGENVGSIPDLGFGVREAWASPSKQSKPAESLGEPIVEQIVSPQTATMLQSENSPLPRQSPKVFASRRKLDLDSHAKPKAQIDDVPSHEHHQVMSHDSFPSSADQAAVRNRRSALPPTGSVSQEEIVPSKPLPSLAELWSDGERPAAKSTADTKLLQKYEEERCRRQHCEQLVQALQTKLLESQQKLAVAVQVDSDKDAAIAKLQGAWNSLADHWRSVEDQRHGLSKQLQDHKLRSESQLKQMQEDHEKLTKLQAAMDAATKSLTSHEANIAVLAEEKSTLQTRLKEEKARLDTQQQNRDKIRAELDESKKRERNLQSELKKNSEQLESIKTELHDFYQKQLERVVRDKLKEFQGQLDTAESALQRELESRERSVAQLAARQLQHVTEKHKLEVSLLEQKHSEELRLMQLQLTKASRQIQELETRLAAHEKRSSTIAERLHGVMENQWREALNIISSPNDSNGRSNGSSVKPEKPGVRNDKGNDTAWMLVQQQQKSQSQCSSRSSVDEAPFSRDGQITHRNATPTQQIPSQTEENDELRKYIKMLLERAPGNPVYSPLDEEKPQSGAKASGSANSNLQLKPPWK
ncbi:uncharacterized protein LOC117647240 isoform X2 [Thrips palmi]|uniref:Uncharacterized protein LOC117647240 isoform X2 n=1 Tax=Thrips palmi TaxID=161013 RepID=A0A6P8Z4U9_THRPL|nr:uncharacterized protein LOC117647240 isoform X2 [Thrips palmi]